MQSPETLPHLFRNEYAKIVSVLCKHIGFERLEIAEEIASETFLTATETWGVKGNPQNPTAWLYAVAKNKAKNYLQRNSVFQNKILPELTKSQSESFEPEIDLSPENIYDSQLRMMFTICHPSISPEAQVGLSLRILCGFGIEEISDAFLTNKETINKRLFRAKEKLREEKIRIELPESDEIEGRLGSVLSTIYLLFNEGYHSISQNKTLRKDLCLEAIRLCSMLVENTVTDKPQVYALLALMCFHTSRFEARQDEKGEQILYQDQDTNLWNYDLIAKGEIFLNKAASGTLLTKYHLEAGIAYWHTQKEDTKEKWENILQLYNRLLQLQYSPIAALNRTYALSKANSKEEAIIEAEKLNLIENHFYFALLGELYLDIDRSKSEENFRKALSLAKTSHDKSSIQKKIDRLSK
ncbi:MULTISPECIES: RNA polymerase sigma factor [unclassified Leptospira]|uniref:RNA polymerase sigma factor n=1 Tax=unclassified Leptospira TaxID=2633828 RepID=UPI0002BFEA75|nr:MULTISPECIES: sigma-70 family RNA polymerase sigma factor [unclassified Leptospira]EMJ99343.1 sigma-70 region 2 [Leptospira sp. B5-022]MCR1792446.1 sigma-70 family RNA polymerase sigma factor [Leptospira sp. id769339]